MNEAKAFLLYKDSLCVLDAMTDEQAGNLFKAIKAYQSGEQFEANTMTKIAMSPFIQYFKENENKYETICKRNKINGLKGGRPPGKNNPNKPTGGQNNPEKPDIDFDLVNDKTLKSKPLSNSPAKNADDIDRIFKHWQKVLTHPRAKIDDKRKKAIRKALGYGYTPDDLMTAIDGCRASDWHMGKNDRGQVYDGLTLILRDADLIDKFIGIIGKGGAMVGKRNVTKSINESPMKHVLSRHGISGKKMEALT